jgi:2-dehydropantoate 2-reductase
VFVAVRRDQLDSVLQVLAANPLIPNILFMLNNPNGSRYLVKTLGKERVLLGFPGAGGTRDGHIVRYALIAQQPTTMGEIGGQRTARLCELSAAFREAGFSTKISQNMDAWLKTHAFLCHSCPWRNLPVGRRLWAIVQRRRLAEPHDERRA